MAHGYKSQCVTARLSRDEIFTQGFTTNVYVKNYGTPIPDDTGFDVGSTIGDATWDGHCGLVLAPDPNTGVCIEAIDLAVNSGDVVNITVTGTFGYAVDISSFAVIGGTLPPGVTFDSTTGIISGTSTATGHYGITIQVNAARPAATGAILGAPKPAGYENHFDFGYRDWVGCCFRPPDNPGFQTWSWYQVGWGMNVSTFNVAAGCSLPLNATQWNNYFEAVNKPQGAWIFYADKGQSYYGIGCASSDAPSGAGDSSQLVACKYAECLEEWYSQNFARPAGNDKFVYDESRVYCCTNVEGEGEGSTWNIIDPTTGLAPIDGTDFSGLWGGPSVDGFYTVSGYSGGVLTLGAKSYDVPSNWQSRSNGDDASCFGRLRFVTAPALLGRVAVTPDVAGTTFAFAEAPPNFGMDSMTHQEQVDLWDASMTSVASNITATRVDDTHFTTAAAYHTAKYVTIHGAAKWYMNDTMPKGDYAVLEWASDFRSKGEADRLAGLVDCDGSPLDAPTENIGGGDVGNLFASFTQTAGCLGFSQCDPKVVCISTERRDMEKRDNIRLPGNVRRRRAIRLKVVGAC